MIRCYDPGTGNWLQADPMKGVIGAPETLASYQFVAGNPSSNTDLLGYLSVGVATQYNLTVGVSNGSWSGGSLQGGTGDAQFLQPAISAQRLQPTISARQLQPTSDPFVRSYRSPAAKGQLATLEVVGPLGGLQGFGNPGSGFSPVNIPGLSGFSTAFGGLGGAVDGFAKYAIHTVSGIRVSYDPYQGAVYGGIISSKNAVRLGTGLKVGGWVLDGIQIGLASYNAFGQSDGLPGEERVLATAGAGLATAGGAAAGALGAKAGFWGGAAICTASGVGVVGAPICGLVGGGVGYFAGSGAFDQVGNAINSDTYQEAQAEALACFPNCSNWQFVESVPAGFGGWWNSFWD